MASQLSFLSPSDLDVRPSAYSADGGQCLAGAFGARDAERRPPGTHVLWEAVEMRGGRALVLGKVHRKAVAFYLVEQRASRAGHQALAWEQDEERRCWSVHLSDGLAFRIRLIPRRR